MLFAQAILLIVHIAAAATWFGTGLGAGGRLRRGLALGGDAADHAIEEFRRQRRIGLPAAVLVYITGLTMIFLLGGFRLVPIAVHWAHGVMLVAVALELALVQPAVRRLASAGAESARKRIAAGIGIIHLLWLTMLVLMFWQRF